MSSFEKALEWVRKEAGSGKPLATIQTTMPEFKDGTFTVNKVLSIDPLLLGYMDEKINLDVNEDVIRVVAKIGKLHGLEVIHKPPEVHLLRDGVLRAVISPKGFAASERALFEDIAREVYGIGGTPTRGMSVKDSWLDSLAQMIGDKRFIDTVFFVILFILLPPTLAAYSLLVTPSLMIPDGVRIGVVLLIVASALYVARLYIRENLQQKR